MCSDCQDMRGVATSTKIGDGIQTIHFRCPSCDHKWTVMRPEKDPTPKQAEPSWAP